MEILLFYGVSFTLTRGPPTGSCDFGSYPDGIASTLSCVVSWYHYEHGLLTKIQIVNALWANTFYGKRQHDEATGALISALQLVPGKWTLRLELFNVLSQERDVAAGRCRVLQLANCTSLRPIAITIVLFFVNENDSRLICDAFKAILSLVSNSCIGVFIGPRLLGKEMHSSSTLMI